jgi:hypothetical protein
MKNIRLESLNETEKRHLEVSLNKGIFKKEAREILNERHPKEGYLNKEHDEFFNKYSGKEVVFFFSLGDYWILEDYNYCLTKDLFMED